MGKIQSNKIFLFIIGMFANFPIKIIGVIKLSEILILLFFVINSPKIFSCIRASLGLKRIISLLFLWVLLASISSIFNDTSVIGFSKGLANLIVFLVLIISIYFILKNDLSLIVYLLIPYGIFSIIFSPYSYAANDIILVNYLYELNTNGNFDNLFDVLIVPVINPLLLSLSIMFYKKKWLFLIILIYGIIALMNEAKSVGFIFIFSSFFMFLKLFHFKIRYKFLVLSILLSILFLLPLISFISQQFVYKGNDENVYSARISQVDKFNPFLLVGRPDPIVGLLAIFDSPIIGHGFNKMDNSYTALAVSLGFLPLDYSSKWEGIQDHSNFLHSIIEGGILACLFWVYVLRLSLKSFYLAVNANKNKFTFLVMIMFFYIFWNVLFSPITRFDFAFTISTFIIFINTHVSSKKNHVIINSEN